jgi:hypothetical protein
LVDAQQRAPFTVLIPDRIPPDWHSTCAFIEPSRRPPSPAAVSLKYRSDDGHASVSLSQYSASEKPDQYELMIKHGGWQTISRDGTDVQVRAPDGPGPRQAQAYIERSETFVFLMSETLTGDELATEGRIGGVAMAERVLDHRCELRRIWRLRMPDTIEGGKDAVPPRGATKWRPGGPAPCDPDRDTRPLQGTRAEDSFINCVVAAVVREHLAAPQSSQDRQALIEFLRAHAWGGVLAKGSELLVRLRPQTRTNDKTTTREHVERRRFARELPRSPPG